MFPGGSNRRELGQYMVLAQIGMEMVAPIGVGLVLDYYFHWSPWGVVVGAILGLIVGMAHLFALVSRQDKTGSSGKPQDRM